MRYLLVISVMIIGLTCCKTKKVDQKAEAETLMNLSREWAKVIKTGDVEKALNYWASDAVLITAGQPALKGHDTIRKMLIGSLQIPDFEVNWEPKEAYVSESGDIGYVICQNYFRMKDSLGNTIINYNNSVEIWKKQKNGSWKNVVDISSPDPTIKTIK